jgi:queuine tRNA-ribosyltransferase
MEIATAHGPILAPTYIPDATRAVVRTLDASDLEAVGIEALMVNSYHLMQRPGISTVSRLGGLHRFMGWSRPIVTDSGGFQVLSLIRENPAFGTIRPNEIVFRPPDRDDKVVLTPEKVIQNQFRLGSDVMIALDDCTGLEASPDEQALSVERTIRWGRRAREEYERQVNARRDGTTPVLVAPVQGGSSADLRRTCAQGLMDAGFTAFGFGGWPIHDDGELQVEMFRLLSEVLPAEAPFFALGVGRPDHLVTVTAMGRPAVFDSSLPTRDARHHRLYRFRPGTTDDDLVPGSSFYERMYIMDRAHERDPEPISETCDALCCRRYGRAYIQHLFRCDDPLARRLATLHNLRFFTQLVDRLRRRYPG